MKKLIVIITAVTLLLCSCIAVGAETIYRYGDWTLTAISGASSYAFGLRSYEGEDTAVTAPDNYGGYPIVAVNSYAFSANNTLRELTLGDQIASIGTGAFLSADDLEKVTLTSSVVSIGESAFAYTPALKEVNLYDSSVESVKKNTFAGSGIKEIALPDTCTAIGDNAFATCSELNKITIPDSVAEISGSAFRNSPNVVICATVDSYAVAYAKKNKIDYVCTDEPEPVLGDVNCDGIVSIGDVTELQQHTADLIKLNKSALFKADVDKNGTVDVSDATEIQRYLAKFNVPYPIGESMNLA